MSLFDSLASSPAVVDATGDRAWLQAMLDVESALARAGAKAGLVPVPAAEAIAAAARAELFDAGDVGRRAVASATPVIPLLSDLRAALPPDVAEHVHLGATSQDIVDTALCLVAYRSCVLILADLAAVADRLAHLTREHRGTVQMGRTLLQQAEPTTFGAVCAGWLVAVDEARAGLVRARGRLAVQLGGPVGTLAGYGERGPQVVALLAEELGLAEPVLPWHTNRNRVAELAAALGIVSGALAGIALDVALLSQTEVGEVTEGSPGGSSAMPHKRNPARSVLVTAAAHRVPALVATVLAGMAQEYQRAAGRWQAEWGTVTELLRLVGGTAAHTRELLGDLRVHAGRMRAAAGDSGPGRAVDLLIARALAEHEGTVPW
ncbi:MAG: 3-carboxy-cis,cis-muconate cycloisomerase [Micromonosporaceae bacterium]